ncbi:MAG: hypothetical protein R3C49_19865 [Planctomycetaceae bacterium]
MDASLPRFALILLSLFISTGATFRTDNFTVTAPTQEVAQQVAVAAEAYRRELAIFWLERPLPNWSRPCSIKVRPDVMGAGGETRFQFVGNEVLNWNMYVQGSLERILDSVLPHEVNHTIFACHFRRPLPRWADEGAATLFEHRSEQAKQLGLLNQVLNNPREFISLRDLLTMKEYPKGYRPMLILYAEGYALADFLVQQGGRKKYLKFMADGERMGWTEAIRANYSHGGVDALQANWKGWVLAGMPKLKLPKDEALVETERPASKPLVQGLSVARPEILEEYLTVPVVRSQSPEPAEMPVRTAAVQGTSRDEPAVSPPTGRRHPLEGAIFFNTPNVQPTGQSVPKAKVPPSTTRTQVAEDADSFRRNSFEAPVPQPMRPQMEATGLQEDSRHFTPQQRKHLSQERRAVTGSIPQWAGFPGQKELF